MSRRGRSWLSAGWTWGRGPWIQVSGRERGGRSSGWAGGRWYLFRKGRR
jgi:hypothetical protein